MNEILFQSPIQRMTDNPETYFFRNLSEVPHKKINEANYFPMYIIKNKEQFFLTKDISLETGRFFQVFFTLPDFTAFSVSSYSEVFQKFNTSIRPVSFVVGREEYIYLKIGRGYIRDMGNNFLVLVCCKDLNKINSDGSVSDPDNLILFISPELILRDVYKNFYRRFKKEILDPYMEKGIEIRVLKSDQIINSVFEAGPTVSFNSLADLKNYTSNFKLENLNSFLPSTDLPF